MIGDMNLSDLQVSVTKLQLITYTYNCIMKMMKEVEKPLFEAKLSAIDQVGSINLISPFRIVTVSIDSFYCHHPKF